MSQETASLSELGEAYEQAVFLEEVATQEKDKQAFRALSASIMRAILHRLGYEGYAEQ